MDATENGDPAVLVGRIAQRRSEFFSSFYRGDKGGSTQYCNWDVPNIAARYLDFWKGVELTTWETKRVRRRNFQPEHMDAIEADFRLILACSNYVGRIHAGRMFIIIKQTVYSVRHPIVWSPIRAVNTTQQMEPESGEDTPVGMESLQSER